MGTDGSVGLILVRPPPQEPLEPWQSCPLVHVSIKDVTVCQSIGSICERSDSNGRSIRMVSWHGGQHLCQMYAIHLSSPGESILAPDLLADAYSNFKISKVLWAMKPNISSKG